MKHVSAVGVCVLSAAIAIGCDRSRSNEAELELGRNGDAQESTARRGDSSPISVTGCLTAQDDRFVLTSLEADAAPVGSTALYQLIDADDELRPHVGTMVQVIGSAPPSQIAQIDQTTPGAIGTSGDSSGAGVSTTQTTRFAATTLDVTSVIAMDRPCPAAAATPR
jgi:hypothetical protein